MPDYRIHDTRLSAVLPSVREAAPPEEWIHKAVAEVEAHEAAGFTFQETSWGYRLRRRM